MRKSPRALMEGYRSGLAGLPARLAAVVRPYMPLELEIPAEWGIDVCLSCLVQVDVVG